MLENKIEYHPHENFNADISDSFAMFGNKWEIYRFEYFSSSPEQGFSYRGFI